MSEPLTPEARKKRLDEIRTRGGSGIGFSIRKWIGVCREDIDFLLSEVNRLETEREELREVIRLAHIHVEELADAWQRGALHEHDGQGGTRSNRNHDVLWRAAEVLTRMEKH